MSLKKHDVYNQECLEKATNQVHSAMAFAYETTLDNLDSKSSTTS